MIREFGEPVYPGLRSVERIANGSDDAPWHTVINGENFHVLQALRSTHREKVDLIYIDPPYNTGNDGWIYNDRYVDTNDRAKSSKWLSFLEKRLHHRPRPAEADRRHHRGDRRRRAPPAADADGPGVRRPELPRERRLAGRPARTTLGTPAAVSTTCSSTPRTRTALTASGRPVAGAEARARGGARGRCKDAWQESGRRCREGIALLSAWWSRNQGEVLTRVSATTYKVDDDRRRSTQGRTSRSPNPRPNLQYDVLHPVTGRPVHDAPERLAYSARDRCTN